MSKHKVKSPCIDICKIDKISGLCRGCLRTVREIKDWKDLSSKRQQALLADLERRRAAMGEMPPADHIS
ncbi:MAG TPA: DUF1289 domain-containing protein [Alphaproteobacteria bacterium]|nr:DUF1289 domain-containing protein [Alphaproteobacteria bacterium]